MQKIQLEKSLSEGFIFYAISTLTIAIQFLFYLIHSPRLAMMDVGGWMFYITAACSHAALWALIPYIISLIVAITVRRHHTHYSCIITQYTCLHRRQCVQSLQVPYQWFCTESPGWRGQQWDFHIQLLALSEDCRSISGYICRQYFAKNTCRPLLYPLSPLWLPSCTCHSDFVCTIL